MKQHIDCDGNDVVIVGTRRSDLYPVTIKVTDGDSEQTASIIVSRDSAKQVRKALKRAIRKTKGVAAWD